MACSIQFACTTTPYLVDFQQRLRGPHPVIDLPVLHNGYTDFVVFNAQAAKVDPAVAAALENGPFDTGTIDNLRAGRAAMSAEREFLVNSSTDTSTPTRRTDAQQAAAPRMGRGHGAVENVLARALRRSSADRPPRR